MANHTFLGITNSLVPTKYARWTISLTQAETIDFERFRNIGFCSLTCDHPQNQVANPSESRDIEESRCKH